MDNDISRYISVVPSKRQSLHEERPFYLFMHFGMNTSTGREWGTGEETVADFNIKSVNVSRWADAALACGAGGIILTCKHHDGFCLWNTETTDFNVMNTSFGRDIVRLLSDECKKRGLLFGVYLSPWDMHEPSYGEEAYNDFFARQLTELLTRYGPVFEVWFDGAKGSSAKAFEYDWNRYYSIVRQYQPDACIAICGPDIRWVGNEGGVSRKSEFSVVPEYLTRAESTEKNSQHSLDSDMKKLTSKDEDLGSRAVLSKAKNLCWYPAEVDVSIRKGWFYPGGGHVKTPSELFNIYLNSVGNNCFLLLNVPPDKNGNIAEKDFAALSKLGEKIKSVYSNPVADFSRKDIVFNDNRFDCMFSSKRKIRYIILGEDTSFSQRVEKYSISLIKPDGSRKQFYSGTAIGFRKIIPVNKYACGFEFAVLSSRSEPVIKYLTVT